MNKKLIFLTLVLLIAAGVTTWFSLQIVKNTDKQYSAQPHNPDGIAFDVTYIDMDKNGLTAHIIYTPKLTHYPYQNSSIFLKPNIFINNSNKQPWHITADSGTSKYGTKIINLVGNVKLHQKPGPNNKELTINTTKATIYTQTKFVKTDQPVKILEPGSTITAIGATADLNKKIVNLLSQVKEIYVPDE
jgi:lipopolysaccharide export system protein LptC